MCRNAVSTDCRSPMTCLHLGYQFSTSEGNQWLLWVATFSHLCKAVLFRPQIQRRSGRLLVSPWKHVENPDFQAISGLGTDLIRNAWDLINLLQFHLIRLTGVAIWRTGNSWRTRFTAASSREVRIMPVHQNQRESCARWEVTWFDHRCWCIYHHLLFTINLPFIDHHLPLIYH